MPSFKPIKPGRTIPQLNIGENFPPGDLTLKAMRPNESDMVILSCEIIKRK